ncbi:MAG: hypothetical protein QM704_04795 [Anaeromyxobacteraceae bacterium]
MPNLARRLAPPVLAALCACGSGVDMPQAPAPTLPVIAVQPADVTALEGTEASFMGGATGTPPLEFQWEFNRDGSWFDVLEATRPRYTIAEARLLDDGTLFRLRVRNAAGIVTSEAARLTVLPAPAPGP